MKEKLLTGIALVLVAALTFAGCSSGVSQEDYDAVVTERDKLQSELDALEDNAALAAAYIDVLLMALTMSDEPTSSEIVELTTKMSITNDEEVLFKWMTIGELRSKVETGEATEDEALAAWMDWLNYVNQQISGALGVD